MVSGVGYIGLQQYEKYQTEKVEKERIAQEKEKEAQALTEAQQKTLEEAQQEIEKLKEESAKSKKKQEALEQKVQSNQQSVSQNFTISATELSPYSGGVIEVLCGDAEGSGFLMNLDIGYVVVTNDHVISGNKDCAVMPENNSGQVIGHYKLDKSTIYEWNAYTDIAILKMTISPAASDWAKPIKDLNYNISSLRSCSVKMPEGSQMVIIGYPAFAKQQIEFQGTEGQISARQVTNGIISGYDSSIEVIGNLPYSNYYVSAKIDSGNSGGVAFSKDEYGLCLLGVPTWLNIGSYEIQGIVQNIRNVMYKK